ncbi:hypothetical protein O181_127804 [Austropuccinia psidii MF-1]|uniref:Uncharacterized protein n=1 Tax=Austropuccinia psidii MF-1 TaxID=1389203 RepID=A0A9Q3KVZ3_9BASI|nr:hypothetical protein [Austropuccinia psidii MF-1]
MEHGQQEVQPSSSLGRTWIKLPEDLSQRDRLQRPYGNHQRLESYQAVWTPGGKGTEDKRESSHYPSYRRTVTQTGPTQILSGSQGEGQISSPLASHHSDTHKSMTRSHHSSQFQEASRIGKGYKGKNKTSSSQRQKD